MDKLCPMTFTGSVVAQAQISAFSTTPDDLMCIGSRCALWDSEPDRVEHAEGSRFTVPSGRGRCGLGKGDNFPDPAQRSSASKPKPDTPTGEPLNVAG